MGANFSQVDVLELNQGVLSSSVTSVLEGMAAVGVKVPEHSGSSTVQARIQEAQHRVSERALRAKKL